MLNLNIDPQAYHVADLVVENFPNLHPDYATDIRSYAWYNGRESGIALVLLGEKIKGTSVIVIVNHRHSDAIAIDKYNTNIPFEFPHHTDREYEEAYNNRFSALTVDEAVEYINRYIEDYF